MSSTAPRRRRGERGYSLIISVTIITLLTMGGVMVLDAVYTDILLSGGDRAALNAMYVSEAGAVKYKQILIDKLYPGGATGAATPGALSIYPYLVDTGDEPLCPESNCPAPPCTTKKMDPPCGQWRRMTDAAGEVYPNGTYHVAVAAMPNGTSYTMRSLGIAESAAGPGGKSPQRLIEVTLGEQ